MHEASICVLTQQTIQDVFPLVGRPTRLSPDERIGQRLGQLLHSLHHLRGICVGKVRAQCREEGKDIVSVHELIAKQLAHLEREPKIGQFRNALGDLGYFVGTEVLGIFAYDEGCA